MRSPLAWPERSDAERYEDRLALREFVSAGVTKRNGESQAALACAGSGSWCTAEGSVQEVYTSLEDKAGIV